MNNEQPREHLGNIEMTGLKCSANKQKGNRKYNSDMDTFDSTDTAHSMQYRSMSCRRVNQNTLDINPTTKQ